MNISSCVQDSSLDPQRSKVFPSVNPMLFTYVLAGILAASLALGTANAATMKPPLPPAMVEILQKGIIKTDAFAFVSIYRAIH